MTKILHIPNGMFLRFPPEAGIGQIALFDTRVTEIFENTHLWRKYKYSPEEFVTLLCDGGLNGILAFNRILLYHANPVMEEFEIVP